MLDGVKHVILVLSGKGGVGKSTVSTQIAVALTKNGHKVGLLDIDLCGPSIPKLLNLSGHTVHQCPDGWVPVYADSEQKLAVMSIGFLLTNRDDAVVWRGPKKHAMIKQFLTDVHWGQLDYLIIDTPPGTSDEHMTVVESLRNQNVHGAVIVTTPQAVAVADVRRELTFCVKTGVPILGIVENMSGFICQNCSECTNIFSKGGGESLAKLSNVPFLGCIPLDPELTRLGEDGQSIVDKMASSQTAHVFHNIANTISNT